MVPLLLLLLGILANTNVFASYGRKDAVVILTEKNFDKEVLQSSDYWLVEFYSPRCGHCTTLEPEYKAAAKKLKKHARLGAVDATVHEQLARLPWWTHDARIVEYVKNSPTAKKLGVSGASVVTLEYDKVYTFLNNDLPSAIFFGSPSKGKKISKAPKWLGNVAESFMEKKKKKASPVVQVAFVPGSENKIATHFGLTEDQIPTVIYVYPTSQKYTVSEASNLNEAVAKKLISDALAKTTAAEVEESLPKVPLFPSPQAAKKKPVVTLKELDATTVHECLAKNKKMCVVVAKEDKALLRSLAKKYRRDPFTFLFCKPDAQVFQALTSYIGDATAEVVVLKFERIMKYSALSGTNDESAMSEFLDKLIDGSSPFLVPSGGDVCRLL